MGKKRVKGEPVFYSEIKRNTMLTLTDTAKHLLDERARELGVTRSELVEQFARGIIQLPGQEQSTKKRKRSQKLPSAG